MNVTFDGSKGSYTRSCTVCTYVCRSTDPLTKTNENGLGVKAFISRGLKAFVWLFLRTQHDKLGRSRSPTMLIKHSASNNNKQ